MLLLFLLFYSYVDQEFLKTNAKCSSCARWRVETAITWGKSQENRKFRSSQSDLYSEIRIT